MTQPKVQRQCGFCNGEAQIILDDDKRREYHCIACDATETITKGKQSWWYHGWKASDGRKLRVPTVQEMNRGVFGWQPEG